MKQAVWQQQHLWALGQMLLMQKGWRQGLVLSQGDQLIACGSGQAHDPLSALNPSQLAGDTLWGIIEWRLTPCELTQLQQWGVQRCVFMSAWPSNVAAEHSRQRAQAQGITVQVLSMAEFAALNRGQYLLQQQARPWLSSTNALCADGQVGPMMWADRSGVLQHWLQRFDTCLLPKSYLAKLSGSFQGHLIGIEESEHELSLSWTGSGQVQQVQLAHPNSGHQASQSLLDWLVAQGFVEVCLDGLPHLNTLLMQAGVLDETRQLLTANGFQSTYEVMGDSVLQSTRFACGEN